MDYRSLGNSGLRVSTLCLGTARFGEETDLATARKIIAAAQDAGVNFIDTADQYNEGCAESILGKVLAGERDRWVLATKAGSPTADAKGRSGLGRAWLMRQIDRSLKRLATDYVDIFYFHRDDPETSLDEAVQAVGDIVRAGKARYFGLSNFSGWRIAQVSAACDRLGVARPIVCQPYYNAMNRMAEVDVIPSAAAHGLGVVPYSPLSRGVLAGRYKPGAPPPADTRGARGDKRVVAVDMREESIVYAEALGDYAASRGMSLPAYAINWVLNNRYVTSVLCGPRTLAHWQGYVAALDHKFSSEDEAILDTLVPPGHASTPGFTDPQYPVTGRQPRN